MDLSLGTSIVFKEGLNDNSIGDRIMLVELKTQVKNLNIFTVDSTEYNTRLNIYKQSRRNYHATHASLQYEYTLLDFDVNSFDPDANFYWVL